MKTLVHPVRFQGTSPSAATAPVPRANDDDDQTKDYFNAQTPALGYPEEPDPPSGKIEFSWQPGSTSQHRVTVFDLLPTRDPARPAALAPGLKLQRRARSRDWFVSFAASVICHGLAFTVIAIWFTHIPSIGRWHVARGNPFAQEGSSNPGYGMQDNAIARKPMPAAAEKSPSPSDSSDPATENPLSDSSSLPHRAEALTATETDVRIGIGESSQRSPHFASARHPARLSNTNSAAAQSAAGQMSPPRIAGPRGQRDGFDNRGLPIPDYPYESQRRGEQGLVVIDVEVLPDGSVGAVHIDSDAGYLRLGKAAADKVKLATFVPARINGKPVLGHIRIPYRFTLQ